MSLVEAPFGIVTCTSAPDLPPGLTRLSTYE